VLLPNPPAGNGGQRLAGRLASAFARALGCFYLFAGRLAMSLRCTGEGAEFVHAVPPGVTVDDVAASLYVRSSRGLVLLSARRACRMSPVLGKFPILAAQVTELADGVFLSTARA
jgi:hypothetical protein